MYLDEYEKFTELDRENMLAQIEGLPAIGAWPFAEGGINRNCQVRAQLEGRRG